MVVMAFLKLTDGRDREDSRPTAMVEEKPTAHAERGEGRDR
jgi:hypothetical protein